VELTVNVAEISQFFTTVKSPADHKVGLGLPRITPAATGAITGLPTESPFPEELPAFRVERVRRRARAVGWTSALVTRDAGVEDLRFLAINFVTRCFTNDPTLNSRPVRNQSQLGFEIIEISLRGRKVLEQSLRPRSQPERILGQLVATEIDLT